jgi:anti-anti-sigma factor
VKATARTTDNGIEIVKLEGKIIAGAGGVQLRDVIGGAMDSGKPRLILDLSSVTTIDSSGIGELVTSYTTFTSRGGKLRLLNLPPKLRELLTVTQLITVFQVYDDEAAALASF